MLKSGIVKYRQRGYEESDREERPEEKAFYVDEVDIDLNPRIGPDWTLPSQQRWVFTPGTNVKRFLVGALNHRTGAPVIESPGGRVDSFAS